MNEVVRRYWEEHPCGTSPAIVGETPARTREWFERIEEYRYRVEPCIHAVAQFTRHREKDVLEIGVGAGTDHLQWARAGARCHGVDLTEAAIELTRAHLAFYSFQSDLRRADAEDLPFSDEAFDVVYAWGVIHHSEYPGRVIREVWRVLRPGGTFLGMVYGRRSVAAFKLWVKHALLAGRPWQSLARVIWHHMESAGTKAYTLPELRGLFSSFRSFEARPMITVYDRDKIPTWLGAYLPDSWGWFIALHATK